MRILKRSYVTFKLGNEYYRKQTKESGNYYYN